jgi:hypothetical protein
LILGACTRSFLKHNAVVSVDCCWRIKTIEQ